MSASPEHAIERARTLLRRPNAWLGIDGAAYALRLGPDRRARIALLLDEAGFRGLVERPGLRPRPAGGWTARQDRIETPPAPPGRPGVIEGERAVMQPDGRLAIRRANLGESPIAWLARRRDAEGRPLLTPAQIAAGERLRTEGERALAGPSLTMRWDALPRSSSGAGGGSSARVEPTDQALSAARRVEAALTACGPRLRPIVERICIRDASLQLAETGLGLRRRQGKLLLREGLQALAQHYGIG